MRDSLAQTWRRAAFACFLGLLTASAVHAQAARLGQPSIVPSAENQSGTSAFLLDQQVLADLEKAFKDNGNGFRNGNRREPRPGPNVPEPMVFDLIRPLGARQGEFEVNVLGLIPMRRTRTLSPVFSFITGVERERLAGIEWAPEVEYAIIDDFAVEFELPFADSKLEAYKGAAQYTFGTAFDEQFIHGAQGILFIDRSNWAVSTTLLYLVGIRFDPVYSFMGMFGFNHEFGGDHPFSPTQVIVNASLFAEVSPRVTLGVEVNYIADLVGTTGLLFMPQMHYVFTDIWSLQFGVGSRAQAGSMIGEAAFRLIADF